MRYSNTSLAGLIAAVGLMATATLPAQGRIDRDVIFAPEGGACVMTGQPTQIRAKKNFVLVWRVTNDCESEITVEVGNFTFNGQSVESPVEAKGVTVPGGQRKTLLGIVKGAAEVGVYTYEVLLQGGQAEDPELVIDP